MGKVLILLMSLLISNSAFANLKNLAIESNISQGEVINYVQNNLPTYKADPTVANCLKKLNGNNLDALYSLFNYIAFKNFERKTSIGNNVSDLKNIKKMMRLGQEAKKGIIYCNE